MTDPAIQILQGDDVKHCWICNSEKFVDRHHYDCREGQISPETVDLCRRCHRTYHDRGIQWFEDEYLDKAIEIENKRRELLYSLFLNPIHPLILFRREDIKRSDYFKKKHKIIKSPNNKQPARKTVKEKQLGFEVI